MEYLEEILDLLSRDEGGHYAYVSDKDTRLSELMGDLICQVDTSNLKTKFYFTAPAGLQKITHPLEVVYVDAGAMSGIEINRLVNAKTIKICQK